MSDNVKDFMKKNAAPLMGDPGANTRGPITVPGTEVIDLGAARGGIAIAEPAKTTLEKVPATAALREVLRQNAAQPVDAEGNLPPVPVNQFKCLKCGLVFYGTKEETVKVCIGCGNSESVFPYRQMPETGYAKPVPPPPAMKEAMDALGKDDTPVNPLDVQVGGDHYKHFPIQPVEFVERNGLSFLEGDIVKRICRWRRPGGKGKQDLAKIKHECDLLIAVMDKISTLRR